MAKLRLLVRSLQQGGKYLFSKECLLYTNTALSCTTSVLGDLMQQNYQRLKNDNTRTWSPTRTLKMAITGLVFGPTVHYWYIFLNNKFPGRSTKAIVQKVLLDQFIFSPVCVTIFLVTVGICEGRSLDQLKNDFKDTGTLMFCTDLLLNK
ncbi:mpv17-like protein 2 isoform X2 [Physella acuta]|uniref:mpv17-like protein 2 isoform X2 n=1 Tax=Physella acuta TaxID=109671 RepID=UPI0027DAE815|nr:mpv17-like protein 2 isoform X2 [Physella acuta]